MMIRWDADGPFRPLHVMNPTRLAFIRSTLCRHFGFVPSLFFVLFIKNNHVNYSRVRFCL